MLRIEIVSSGDEVITGSIDDTNASFLSRELCACGLEVNRRHTVGDSLSEIEALFTEISKRQSIVIVTGGLGPTNDDLTTLAVSHVAQVPLCLSTEWLERIKEVFKRRGRIMTESNTKQAMLPQGCEIIDNPRGTACGFALKIGEAFFIFAPGVPSELKVMWQESIKQLVLSHLPEQAAHMEVRKCIVTGVGESNLTDVLKHLPLPEGIVFGDRAVHPIIELKLIGRNVKSQLLDQCHDIVTKLIARYAICQGEYDPAALLQRLQVALPRLNIIDLVCQGHLAAELQRLNLNVGSALFAKVNLNEQAQADQNDLATGVELLKTYAQQANTICLMPSEVYAAWQHQEFIPQTNEDGTAVFSYTLVFNLKCQVAQQEQDFTGALQFNFKPAKYAYFQSQRHRNFLTTLSLNQMIKLITQEQVLTPDDCEVCILEFAGTGASQQLKTGVQRYGDMQEALQQAILAMQSLSSETSFSKG